MRNAFSTRFLYTLLEIPLNNHTELSPGYHLRNPLTYSSTLGCFIQDPVNVIEDLATDHFTIILVVRFCGLHPFRPLVLKTYIREQQGWHERDCYVSLDELNAHQAKLSKHFSNEFVLHRLPGEC